MCDCFCTGVEVGHGARMESGAVQLLLEHTLLRYSTVTAAFGMRLRLVSAPLLK